MGKDYQCFVKVSIESKTSYTSYYKFEFYRPYHVSDMVIFGKRSDMEMFFESIPFTRNSDGIETIRKCFNRILRYSTNTGKKYVYLDFAIDDKGYVVVTHEEYNKFKADRFLNKLFG